MTRRIFDEIAEGLREAIEIAMTEKKSPEIEQDAGESETERPRPTPSKHRPLKRRGLGDVKRTLSLKLSEETYDKLRAYCDARHNISFRVALEMLIEEHEQATGETL